MNRFVSAHSRLRAAALVATVAVTMLAAGCGGDDKTAAVTAASASPTSAVDSLRLAGDLCQYLTADDAAEALGGAAEKLPQPEPINTAGTIVQTCAYSSSGGTAAVLFRRSTATGAEAAFDGARSATPLATDLKGIGERAFYNPDLGAARG